MENVIHKYSSLSCPTMVFKLNRIASGQIMGGEGEKICNPKKTSEEGNFSPGDENDK